MYKNYILFKTRISHELQITGGVNLLFHEGVKNLLKKRERRYYVSIRKEYIQSQYAPAESASFSKMDIHPGPKELEMSFSYFITHLEMLIEVFDDEVGVIEKLEPDSTSLIFQSFMLSFSRYYNEIMKGNDFFKPMVHGFGPQIFFLMTDYGEKNTAAHISGSFSIKRNHPKSISEVQVNEIKHIPWRYYFYKAVDCFDICEYLDVVVWCAISIETYVMRLIRINNLEKKIAEIIEQKEHCSFFDEIKILNDSGIISPENKELLRKMFSIIKDYRNEIVHGDIDSTFYSMTRASKSIELLNDYYVKNEEVLL